MSCLVEELRDALEKGFRDMHLPAGPRPRKVGCSVPCGTCDSARAVLERAKEHDCIPVDDVMEAAGEGHRYG